MASRRYRASLAEDFSCEGEYRRCRGEKEGSRGGGGEGSGDEGRGPPCVSAEQQRTLRPQPARPPFLSIDGCSFGLRRVFTRRSVALGVLRLRGEPPRREEAAADAPRWFSAELPRLDDGARDEKVSACHRAL